MHNAIKQQGQELLLKKQFHVIANMSEGYCPNWKQTIKNKLPV